MRKLLNNLLCRAGKHNLYHYGFPNEFGVFRGWCIRSDYCRGRIHYTRGEQ